MKLYIDCEFNGKDGELISMALVGEDGREFYEVAQVPQRIDSWVAKHVIPVLHKEPVGAEAFRGLLRQFIAKVPDPEIVADWPVDIGYFCMWCITGEYPAASAPVFKATILSLNTAPKSALPHNALEDARAIAKAQP